MAKIISLNGKKKKDVGLPEVFDERYRPDLIKKAVLSYQSKRRQKYGSNKKSGFRTSAHYEGKRHQEPSVQMMNREMSRMPREHGDTGRRFRALLAPHAVGGRRAHPPKAEKNFGKKMNKKERKKAIRSAIAATANEDAVKERNHKFELELPIVVEDKLKTIEKTSEFVGFLEEIGLGEELKRAKVKKVRAGKGKNRGRKYKRKVSVLIVINENEGVVEAAGNIPGVDVVKVENINAEILSPGAHGARLTVYTESAMEKIEERWKR